jgi:hypothetical protein
MKNRRQFEKDVVIEEGMWSNFQHLNFETVGFAGCIQGRRKSLQRLMDETFRVSRFARVMPLPIHRE